jgi:antibiotic biosynthesis monooxygenase (ABM) superfamily enzyme
VREAARFAGYMGADVVRPQVGNEYIIIFRFSSYENLVAWEKSPERKKWFEKALQVVEGEDVVEKHTGLEFWFTPAGRPARYKMAAVTIAVITAILLVLFPPLEGLMEGLPDGLRTLVGVSIMVLLMTYLVMPVVTSVLRPWLYRS